MMKSDEHIIASVKYEGELVKDGYLDAKKSGEVLIGIDELVKYFVYQENPDLRGYEFEIPIRVRKGSWEALLSDNAEALKLGGQALALWLAAKYGGTALEEVAKNDFKDVSFKEIIKKAFKGIVSIIRLSKHLGTLSKKKFDNVEFSDTNDLVKIINDDGEELWITVEILELYSNCPQTIFNKLTKVVEQERKLVVGVNDGNTIVEETITTKYKYIFTKTEEDDEIVLPELTHGQYVEIKGHITRGNEKSNTIGFLYEGHIITCFPQTGNIKQYKSNLFSNCILKGIVNREDKEGNVNEKRPRIAFTDIVAEVEREKNLFD